MTAQAHSCIHGRSCKAMGNVRDSSIGCLHNACPNIPPQRVLYNFTTVGQAVEEALPSPAPSEAEQRRAAFRIVS